MCYPAIGKCMLIVIIYCAAIGYCESAGNECCTAIGQQILIVIVYLNTGAQYK